MDPPNILARQLKISLELGVDLHHAPGFVKHSQSHRNLAHDGLVETFQPLNLAPRGLPIAQLPPATNLLHRNKSQNLGIVITDANTISGPVTERIQGFGLRGRRRNHHDNRRATNDLRLKDACNRLGSTTIENDQIDIEAPGQSDALGHIGRGKEFYLGPDLAESPHRVRTHELR